MSIHNAAVDGRVDLVLKLIKEDHVDPRCTDEVNNYCCYENVTFTFSVWNASSSLCSC